MRLVITLGGNVLREFLGGTTVYGIAVGNFVDADFPAPDLDIQNQYRHHWIGDVEGIEAVTAFPPQEQMIPKRPPQQD